MTSLGHLSYLAFAYRRNGNDDMNAALQQEPLRFPNSLKALVFGAAILASTALIYHNFPSQSATAARDPIRVDSQENANLVERTTDYRALAMQRFNAGKLFAPAGDNALELYLSARAADPKDYSSVEAVLELLPMTMDALELAMQAQDRTETTRLFALLTLADPKSARLIALKARWSTMQQSPIQATFSQAPAALTALQSSSSNNERAAQATELSLLAEPDRAENSVAQTQTISAAAPPAVEALPSAKKSLPTTATVGPSRSNATRIVEARALSTIAPAFPADARRRRIKGWVELDLAIDDAGRVIKATVVSSEPSKIFEIAARQAVLRWRFSPKLVDDVPTASSVRRRINFDLNG